MPAEVDSVMQDDTLASSRAQLESDAKRSCPGGIRRLASAGLKTKLPFLALLAGALAPGVRGDWSFVIMGDTRDSHSTTTGISPYLNTIATRIAEIQPDLVLVSGDLCNGNATDGLTSLT